MNFKYVVREIQIKKFNLNVYKQEVIICRKIHGDIILPSAFTDFIICEYNNESLSSKISAAYIICPFLNFINEKINVENDMELLELKYEGIYGLKYIHIIKFINYCTNIKKNNYNTVKNKKNVLYKFYKYLVSRRIIKNEFMNINDEDEILIKEGFLMELPEKKRPQKKILKNMEEEIWRLFLDFAEQFYIDIVFGLYLQFFGGVRQGAVVNITLDDIFCLDNSTYMYVDIHDNQMKLFGERNINLKTAQVKRPRNNQAIINFNGKLFAIYEKHLKQISKVKNNKTRALFYDRKGNSMSGDVYIKRFSKLKMEFIDYLEDEGLIKQAKYLTYYSWGSHIGRHVFTNNLLEEMLENLSTNENGDNRIINVLLSQLRGDMSSESAQEYIDNRIIENYINKYFNNMN
jgi:hypothetical protein